MAVLEVIMAIFAVIEMVARSGWEPAATWPEEMFALTGMQLPDRRMLQYAGRMATAGTMPKKNEDKKDDKDDEQEIDDGHNKTKETGDKPSHQLATQSGLAGGAKMTGIEEKATLKPGAPSWALVVNSDTKKSRDAAEKKAGDDNKTAKYMIAHAEEKKTVKFADKAVFIVEAKLIIAELSKKVLDIKGETETMKAESAQLEKETTGSTDGTTEATRPRTLRSPRSWSSSRR